MGATDKKELDRVAAAPENQEITPAMIKAGRWELAGYSEGFDDANEAVVRIYRAMRAACNTT